MDNNIGIFVGRMCPMHIGHQAIISQMIEDCGVENCIIFVGSSNAKISWRVPFSYRDRSRWAKRLFKGIRIVGMPDLEGNDQAWLEMLDDYINAIFPGKSPIFYGGSTEDIVFFYENGSRKVKIVDRKDIPITATNVRILMLQGLSISDVVDKRIEKEVREVFTSNMKKLEKL